MLKALFFAAMCALFAAPSLAEMRTADCDVAPWNAFDICAGEPPGTVLDVYLLGFAQTVDPDDPGMLDRLIVSVSSEQEDTAECDQVAIDAGFCDQAQLGERVPQFISADRFTDSEIVRIIESLIFEQEAALLAEQQPKPKPMTTKGKGTGKGPPP